MSQAHLFKMFTCGAMDNGDFMERSSISGTKSGHISMQVLYQEILSAHESKTRASEMSLSKSTARLP